MSNLLRIYWSGGRRIPQSVSLRKKVSTEYGCIYQQLDKFSVNRNILPSILLKGLDVTNQMPVWCSIPLTTIQYRTYLFLLTLFLLLVLIWYSLSYEGIPSLVRISYLTFFSGNKICHILERLLSFLPQDSRTVYNVVHL